MTRRPLAFLFLLAAATAAFGQQQPVPAPEEFLGYAVGRQFTPHRRIVEYFDELAKRSPYVSVEKIGETYEQRPLVLATLTAPKNRASLEEIRQRIVGLAAGRGEIGTVAKSTPAVVWLAFGIHGNESSSSEAAMVVASRLLSDPALTALLEDLVVVIDPVQNPDGRERYVEWYRRTRGRKPNPDPESSEHAEPWPGGRFNHYLFDMNRDWAWASQAETRARIAAYNRWMPQVFVDFHEMSSQSTYFFPPGASPVNANLPPAVEDWLDVFGKANAAEFSRQGWPFFVSEHFDLFYPAYGDSWPSLHGAIGMTYEMAGGGRAGLAVERNDGTLLTLADRVRRHATAALTTVRTAAANREALLRYTWEAARVQIESGRNTFLLLPGSPSFDELVALLLTQGIRVDTLQSPAALRATRVDADVTETRTFPAGTAVVSTRQARGALANTLLERAPSLGKTFVEEQRAKTEADEPDDFYDLTTWSLPLAMNVEAWVTTAPVTAVREYVKPASRAFETAGYAYLVDGLDPGVYAFAGRLLEEEIPFSVAASDLTIGAHAVARGSIVLLRGGRPEGFDAKLQALVNQTGVTVVPLASGWSGGTALGSEKIRQVEPPRIALVGGAGTNPTSYGMLWHTIDADIPIPHSTVTLDSLRSIDLAEYNVLVFPDGNYAERLAGRTVEKIKQWVDGGGTIVAVKGASAFLRQKDVEISKIKPWAPPKPKDEQTAPAGDERYNEFRIPGSAFRTTMNTRSYLTFGIPRPPAVLIEGANAWLPLEHRVDNVLTVGQDDPLISGVAWKESLDRVRGSLYVGSEPFGDGHVVTFADDPHFRLFWKATLPIFLNAVLYSPTFPR